MVFPGGGKNSGKKIKRDFATEGKEVERPAWVVLELSKLIC